MEFKLEPLPYNYDALEPIMDAQTVELHYAKHHQTYVNNLNAALAKHPEIEWDLENLLKNIESLPQDISVAVKNNGGGVYNHNMFWKVLTPNQNTQPSGNLLNALIANFGSVEQFKQQFESAGLKHFGSGWVWLVIMCDGSLEILTTQNQDTPLAYGKPIFTIDLWEHAYYLKHQNRRADYLKNIWQIVNWQYVEQLYNQHKNEQC